MAEAKDQRSSGARELRDDLHDYYNRSDDYKEQISRSAITKFLRFYAELFDEVPNFVDGPVLDVGCGVGTSTNFLFDMGFDVTGLDLSELFILDARKKSKGPDFICASAEDIPFDNNHFRIVGANSFIEHVPDVTAVLREMIRVTRPGGCIILHGPNLLSPLVPLVKAMRALVGQEVSPVYGSGVVGCIRTSARNARILRAKRKSKTIELMYRKPLLDDSQFTADDADATWLANRWDLCMILEELGCEIVVSHREPPGLRSLVSKVFPDAMGVSIIAEKIGR